MAMDPRSGASARPGGFSGSGHKQWVEKMEKYLLIGAGGLVLLWAKVSTATLAAWIILVVGVALMVLDCAKHHGHILRYLGMLVMFGIIARTPLGPTIYGVSDAVSQTGTQVQTQVQTQGWTVPNVQTGPAAPAQGVPTQGGYQPPTPPAYTIPAPAQPAPIVVQAPAQPR